MKKTMAAGVVLLSLMLTACATTGQNNNKTNSNQDDYTVYMPDGVNFSVRCKQSGFFGFFTGDVEECSPMLTPVWSVDPDDLFKRQGYGGI